MDSSQGSSFIPKAPVRGTVNKRRVRKVYVFTYLIYIFFIGSLLTAGGAWLYKLSVQRDLDAMKVTLNSEREQFNQADLERIRELNQRMEEVKRLLDNTVSMRSVLEAIEAVTVSAVDITGFSYHKEDSGALTLALAASADSFNTALFQRQVLASNPILAGATFDSVTYAGNNGDQAGEVITFTIDRELVRNSIQPGAPSTGTDLVAPIVATSSEAAPSEEEMVDSMPDNTSDSDSQFTE